MKNNYDNLYSFDNVYGHSLAILQRHESVRDGVRSVHLDLGCGYGRIAEEIEDRLGLHYIGLDFDASSVESLLSRGKEAHRVNFSTDLTALKEVLASRLQGRRIASITILDVLEHLPEPTATNEAAWGASPARASTRLAARWVDDPIDDTPMRRPARSATALNDGSARNDTPRASCGARPSTTSER